MDWQQFPQLRQPAEFAAAKFLPIGRSEVAAGMLQHSKSLLPTSLTRLGDSKKSDGTAVQASGKACVPLVQSYVVLDG